MRNFVEINTFIHVSYTSREIFPGKKKKRKKEKAAMKIGSMNPIVDSL
jgi:hypothetical protein